MSASREGAAVKVYIDTSDWWVGYYRGPSHHYVCPLPTVVIRWRRRTRVRSTFAPNGDTWLGRVIDGRVLEVYGYQGDRNASGFSKESEVS